jgi:energy-coupling factor transporter ATP-binding protein EcfA2
LIDDYTRPLCPLKVAEHIDRYLNIDSFEERLKAFQADFADPADWIDQGHLVVVAGDRGYGKTSLIQRCAAWLRAEALRPVAGGQPPCRVVVVDLSDEGWALDETVDVRMRRALERILSKLGNELGRDDRDRIEGGADPRDGFFELGELLAAKRAAAGARPIVLAVLLQGYPKSAEVGDYYRVAVPGMIFFAEVYQRADIADITRMLPEFKRFSAEAHYFALDTLKAGDADLLAFWIRNAGISWPFLAGETVDLINNAFIPRGVGMAQLTKLTWAAQRIARSEAATVVTTSHVAQYYMQET